MNNNKVSIATKPLVYSAFRYIENKVWNALAEYVDNAVQSFKDHIDILKNGNIYFLKSTYCKQPGWGYLNPHDTIAIHCKSYGFLIHNVIYSIVRKSHNSEYQVFTILL